MVADQIPRRGKSQRYDQTGEFARPHHCAGENRGSERIEVVLILVDAVFAGADEKKTNQQDRHLERRQSDKKFAAAMPDGNEMNERDHKRKQDSDSKE